MQTTPHLYKNMYECMRIAHCNSVENALGVKPRFFKVLNNKEIVSVIVENEGEVTREYGFLHLNEELDVVRCSSRTHSCLLEILKQASEIHTSTESIGYFKLLNDNEIVMELHVKY